MKAKTYKIKTVQDMIDCTNKDNLDDFLVDLKGLLTEAHAIRTIAEFLGKGLHVEKQKITTEGFTWIDDGKHDIKIIIGTK